MSPWWFIVGSVLVCLLVHYGFRWWQRRRISSAPLFESSFRVECDSREIICYQADASSERISWSDLQKVEIFTTDEGPFVPDVFWILHGSQHRCTIPQGATGDDLLLERLQELPGFDKEAFITSMSSPSNARFVCWVAPQSA